MGRARGIYPFRGITASFVVSFDQDIPGLATYKKSLHAAISKSSSCDHLKGLSCYGYDNGKVYEYLIPSTSPLFPQRGSIVRLVVEGLGVNFGIYRRSPPHAGQDVPTYRWLGGFGIELWIHPPTEWHLLYDVDRDYLYVQVEKSEVPDEDVLRSQVYSLVDFIPGLIMATADFADDPLCDDLKNIGVSKCRDILDPLTRHLSVSRVQLSFRYPKALYFSDQGALDCAGRRHPVVFILKDIDSGSDLGAHDNEVPALDKQKACEAITKLGTDPVP